MATAAMLRTLALSLFLSYVAAERTYTITAPRAILPGSSYHVVLSLHNTPEPVTLTANISGVESGSQQKREVTGQITVSNDETQELALQIDPSWRSGEYKLSVKGTGGVEFDRERDLIFVDKKYSTFIQTDKAIYQPGQTVKFRVVVVGRNLEPYATNNLTVYIRDAQRNIIKRWTNLEPERGIFSNEIELSDQPVLGDWTIFASNINHNDQDDAQKSFTIAEYVLPKFEVTITPPPYGTFNDSEAPVKVSAKYTYGKPVKGSLVVNVSDSDCYRYPRYCTITPVEVNTEIDGEATVDIPVGKMSFSSWQKNYQRGLTVQAIVTENLTGRKQNSTGQFNLHPHREKISITQSSDTYKPGLKHIITIVVQYQDDSPVSDATEPVRVSYGYFHGKNQEVNLTVPTDGTIELDLFPPEDSQTLSVDASYKQVTAYASANKAVSISTKYLQLGVVTPKPKVGEEAEFEVNSTFHLDHITYEVVGRGDIIAADTVKVPSATTFRFKVPITQAMAPNTKIVAYYVSQCGETIADSIGFAVDGVFQTPVSLGVSENDTKPGAPLEVTVKTKPQATVAVSGIDQSVLLLKTGNEFTKDDVINDLEEYNSGRGQFKTPSYFGRSKRSLIWRPSRNANNLEELFRDAGILFISNGLYSKETQHYGLGGGGGAYALEVSDQVLKVESAMLDAPMSDDSSVAPTSADAPRIRKDFVETWIWTNATAGADGTASLKLNVPDTITSWVINAFAMDPETGLGISDSTSKVRVFRPFFVSLNLPYSIIRGESVGIQALVFNYLKEDAKVDVTLDNEKGQYELLTKSDNDVRRKRDTENTENITKTVQVKSNDAASVVFWIRPNIVGQIDIKVKAISPTAGDALVRKLLVKPEGVPKFHNKALLVDLREKPEFEEVVPIEIPDESVPGSERVEVSAIGDLMGPVVNNLDNLIRMPYGCGEQNMVNFVPNIVVSQYLTNVGQLTHEIKKRSTDYMEKGYQRELTYKRNDGSFSAFGQNDKNGSTWLTAFVARSFIQAKPFIAIDDGVIQESLRYLAQMQLPNGTFEERGEVHHKGLQGGSSSGLGLAAFVLNAFLEYKNSSESASSEFDGVIQNATQRLQESLPKLDDVYDLSIATYALHLAGAEQRDAAFSKLNAKAETKGELKHWSKPVVDTCNATDFYCKWRLPPPTDVEATSYALLTYVLLNKVPESIPIMKWLVTQRNELGGFASTQDTVVGIQALAAIAARVTSKDTDINVLFNYEGRQKSLAMNKDNSIVLQKIELPSSVQEVQVTAKGKGVGIVQVSWSYYVNTTESEPVFKIEPSIARVDNDSYTLTVCAVVSPDSNEVETNMAIIDVHTPSGYVIDQESLPGQEQIKTLKRVELKEGNTGANLYFDQISQIPVCPKITIYRVHEVEDLQQTPVSVYDYYENNKRADSYYELPSSADEP